MTRAWSHAPAERVCLRAREWQPKAKCLQMKTSVLRSIVPNTIGDKGPRQNAHSLFVARGWGLLGLPLAGRVGQIIKPPTVFFAAVGYHLAAPSSGSTTPNIPIMEMRLDHIGSKCFGQFCGISFCDISFCGISFCGISFCGILIVKTDVFEHATFLYRFCRLG